MNEEQNRDEISLASTRTDYVASAAQAALGAVPFVGSLLAEIAGQVIPNQRIERLVKFAELLQERISVLEEEMVTANLSNENFTDLVEEGLRQAARALTDERRKYISSLISNSITSNDIEFYESKYLLKILNQINDIEVIWLRSYFNPLVNSDREFRARHANILNRVVVNFGSSQAEVDKSTLKDSYKEHLASLGLLEKEFEMMDTSIRGVKLKTRGYRITSLGRLLLCQLGFSEDESRG